MSSDGRYAAFERADVCGPILRDRVAGTSTALFSADTNNFCPILKPYLGMSASGQRIAVTATDDACLGPYPYSYSERHYVYSILDIPTHSILTPVPCTDRTFYGDVNVCGVGATSTPPTVTTISEGHLDSALLTGDGQALVTVRQLVDLTLGSLGGGNYGSVSYRAREVLDRVPASGGTPVRLATLYDSGTQPTPVSPYTGCFGIFPRIGLSSVSIDGSVVGFNAANLLTPGDTGEKSDAYVLSSASGSFAPLVNVPEGSSLGAMSTNGRFLLFSSEASSLVPNDTNNYMDLFLYDRLSSSVERVSVGTGGTQANRPTGGAPASVSDDGRFVVFATDASTIGCAGHYGTPYVRDRVLNRTRAPFHRPSGAPAFASDSSPSAFSYGGSAGAAQVSSDGSTLTAVSSDWMGRPQDDPGVTKQRVWATPTQQTVPDC